MPDALDNELALLIQRCIRSDRKAQKILYMKYYSYGMSICYRYVNNKNESISLLNDGFLKVFNNLNAFDVSKDFKPWFKTILVNTIFYS